MDTQFPNRSSFEDKFGNSRELLEGMEFHFREITAEEATESRVKGYEYIID